MTKESHEAAAKPDVVPNLGAFLAADTADLHVLVPGTNKRSGWVITCAGPAHPQTIALNEEVAHESAQKNAEIERAQVNGRKWKGDKDYDPEADRRKSVSRVCRRIVTWTPVDFGSGPIEFSHEAAVKLFLDRRMGSFYLQLVEFITAETAFIKDSAID